MPKVVHYTCKGMRGWTKKTAQKALKARQKAWDDPVRKAERVKKWEERMKNSPKMQAYRNRKKNADPGRAEKIWATRYAKIEAQKKEKEDALKLYKIAHPELKTNTNDSQIQEIATKLLAEYNLECPQDQPLEYYADVIKSLNPQLAVTLKIK